MAASYINLIIIFMTFSILYVHVIWNQKQHSTICYAVTSQQKFLVFQDAFKTSSWTCLTETTSSRHLQYVFTKTNVCWVNLEIETGELLITSHENDFDQILLFGNECHRYVTNRMILLSADKFCLDGKRLDLPLF